jgi:hypothetical protein
VGATLASLNLVWSLSTRQRGNRISAWSSSDGRRLHLLPTEDTTGQNAADAATWLADRSKMLAHPDYYMRERQAKRWSMWGPRPSSRYWFCCSCRNRAELYRTSLTHAGRLSPYRVRIPLTWMVLGYPFDKRAGSSYVVGWTGKGLARDWHFVPRLSAVSFATEDFELAHGGDQQPVSARTFSVGTATITCWEYPPYKLRWGYEVGLASWISCASSKRDFEASFVGHKA